MTPENIKKKIETEYLYRNYDARESPIFEQGAEFGYSLASKEIEDLKRLLHDLTPGGSEFYNDPKYCAEWIRKNREENHYSLTAIIKKSKAEIERLKKII